MYNLHPSVKLNDIFRSKPYQGAKPGESKFLFFGLDANYEETLAEKWYFPEILDYLADGEDYWQTRSVHHPFMLPHYKGDGKLYHRRFAQISFKPCHANQVSFVELVNFPTFGRSKLDIGDLSREHLLRLSDWVLKGESRYVFIPATVFRLMTKIDLFEWLPDKPIDQYRSLPVLFASSKKKVFLNYHFSCVGKHCLKRNIDEQLSDIGKLI